MSHQTMEGVSKKKSKAAGFPWLRVSFFIFACGFVIIASGPLPEKVWRKYQRSQQPRVVDSSPAAKPVDVPAPELKPSPPAPKPPIKKPAPPVVKSPPDHTARSGGDIRKMSKGFKLHTKVTVEKGDLASKERKRGDSYTAHYELKIKLPKPSVTLESLEKVSPKLSLILPGMKDMMPKAEVSRFFYQSYNNKIKRLKLKSTQLSELMTKHNFYDCETILNLKHPKTGKRVLLLQSEMDVVSDGSDGDRLHTMPEKVVNSSYYQPMTSYGWRKTGETPNPLIAGWKGRIKKANAEMAKKETKADRKAWLKMRIKKIKREIQDMEARSYLIAEYDPFIVMPINMVTYRGDQYGARVGDYAVVIYKGEIYPTIVGDAGPSFKTGEASLRMAKQLNARAGIYSRPVSDLTVTYLVFPGSADKFQAPDYTVWQKRCAELLEGIGGLGEKYKLFTWKNTLPEIKTEEDLKKDEAKAALSNSASKDSNEDNKSDSKNTGVPKKTNVPKNDESLKPAADSKEALFPKRGKRVPSN